MTAVIPFTVPAHPGGGLTAGALRGLLNGVDDAVLIAVPGEDGGYRPATRIAFGSLDEATGDFRASEPEDGALALLLRP